MSRRVVLAVLTAVAVSGAMAVAPPASAAPMSSALQGAVLTTPVGAAPAGPAVEVGAGQPGPAEGGLRAADGELLGMRTEFSQTFPSEQGPGFDTRVFGAAVNFRDGQGVWQRIDPALQPAAAGRGFDNRAADFDVELPARASEAFGVSSAAGSVRFVLQGAADSPAAVDGATAEYEAVQPGLNVELESTISGLKETLVLTGPDSPAASTFAVELSAGLVLAETALGGLEVRDGLGRVHFEVPPPFAVDSASSQPAYTDAVRFEVGGTPAAPTVTLALDPSWLADPARVFPVLVDPTTTVVRSPDATYINSGATSTNYHTASATTIKAGGPYRALFHFDVAAALPRDITLLSSDLRLWATANTAASTALSSHVLSSSFSGAAATWTKRTSTASWSSAGGDFGPATETDSVTAVNDDIGWLLTDAAQQWLQDPISNKGVLVQAADTSGGVVDFVGRDVSGRPYLNVNWVPRSGLRSVYSYDEQELTDTSRLSVNVATGNLTYSVQDLALSGPKLSLNVTRTYNSMAPKPNHSGQPLPQRWALSLGRDVAMVYYPDGILFTGTTGDALWFKRTSGSGTSSVYQSPAGSNATLTRNKADYGFELQLHQPYLLYKFNYDGVLESVRDANGNTLTLGHNQSPAGISSRTTTLTDVVGRTQDLSYNTAGRLETMADGAWAGTAKTQTTYEYDSSSTYLTRSTNRNGESTGYGYGCADGSGRLCTITDPRGTSTTLAYDSRGRVTEISRPIDASGAVARTLFRYQDGSTVVTDANGHTTTYVWDGNSQVTSVQDPLGHTRDRSYTANGDVKTITGATVTGGSRATTSFGYDEQPGSAGQPATNNLLSSKAPTGATTSSRYADVTGAARYQPANSTDAQGSSRAYTYSAAGNVKSSAEADSTGAEISGGEKLTYRHEGEDAVTCGGKPGQLCETIDGRGKTTRYAYNTRGELTTVTPPAPLAAQNFGYDAHSRVITQDVVRTAGSPAERQGFSYDKLGRDLSTTFQADNSTVTFGYDGNGNVTSRADSSGTTSYGYDKLNRLTSKTIPGNTTVSLGYDALGNLLTHTAHGDTMNYTYDAANRLIRMVEPGGNCDANPEPDRCTRFTYDDDDDRRLQTLYPNDVVQSAGYDTSGRQVKAEASGPAGLLDSFAYSYARTGGDGMLRSSVTHKARATDTGLVTRYAYDSLNRLTAAKANNQEISGDTPLAWWKLDEATGTSAADSSGNSLSGTYASSGLTLGRGSAVTGSGNRALKINNPSTWDSGRVVVGDEPRLRLNGPFSMSLWVKITAAPAPGTYPGMLVKGSPHLAGGGYEMYYSDNNADGRITASFKMNGQDYFWFGADTLTVGQWHHLAVTYDATTATAGTVRTYLDGSAKDAEPWLLGENTNTADLLLGRNNSGGNSTLDDVALFAKTLSPEEIDRHARAGLSDASYSYDKAGNRTAQRDLHARATDPADSRLGYTHNDANQITGRDSNTNFSYDGYGNTLRAQSAAGDLTTTYNPKNQATSFTRTGGASLLTAGYAGATQDERLTSGGATWTNSPLGVTASTTGSASSLVTYLRDPDGQLLGIRVGNGTNATRYYYTFDGLGSVTGLTDANGTRINTYRYDPYGQATLVAEQLAQPFRYTGGQLDTQTGLYKLGIRYYDPTLGRFTQPDPTGQDPHYTYAANNPINFVDPTGAAWGEIVGTGVGAVVVGGLAIGLVCAGTAGVGCVAAAGVAGGALGGAIGGGTSAQLGGRNTRQATLEGALGGALGGLSGLFS